MFKYDKKLYEKSALSHRLPKRHIKFLSESKELIQQANKSKKIGRRSTRSVRKPTLKLIIDIYGNSNLARALGITPPRISNWLYTDVRVPPRYAKIMEKLVFGLVKWKEIKDDIKELTKND